MELPRINWCPWCGRFGALAVVDPVGYPICANAFSRGGDVNCVWYSHIEKKIDTAVEYTKKAFEKRYGRHRAFKKLADNIPSFWTDIAELAANGGDEGFQPANANNTKFEDID